MIPDDLDLTVDEPRFIQSSKNFEGDICIDCTRYESYQTLNFFDHLEGMYIAGINYFTSSHECWIKDMRDGYRATQIVTDAVLLEFLMDRSDNVKEWLLWNRIL